MLHVNRNSLRSSSTHVGESVPAWVYPYRAGLIGGALGGAAMIAVAVVYSLTSGRGIWLPVNLIGATLIPSLQSASLATLAQFTAAALVAGVLLHTALSIGLGFVLTVLLPTLPGSPVIWSLTIGALLWSLAGLIGLPLLNPIMGRAVDAPIFFIEHVAYGLALGSWIARTPKIPAE
jgi:hypothetical protein